MGDDLKPCPFCGSTELRIERNPTRSLWEVECYACWGMMTSTVSLSKVVHDWNRRRPEDALRARAEAAEVRAAQARADARVLACQWRAVDDTEDLQFFGACWREAHPGRSESDLGRDPTMADLVTALRRALGGV